MDMAFLEPKVKSWKHWKWNYNSLSPEQYQNLKKIRNEKLKMYEEEDRMPYWFNPEDTNKLHVIFIRDMDEYLAGQRAEVNVGLYRNWLWPNKIAVPASNENVERWQHLNLEKRQQRERQQKMEALSTEIAQVRFEMKVRRDPESEEVYSMITKQRIARKLLLLKRIMINPSQIIIRRLSSSMFSAATNEEDEGERGDGTLDVINDAGSYMVQLAVDEAHGFQFEFRLNVRYNDIERENRTPFAMDEAEDEESDEDEERDSKGKKVKDKEMRTALKKWSRAKHANQMLDHLLRKSRYSALYSVSKLDLTQKHDKQRSSQVQGTEM